MILVDSSLWIDVLRGQTTHATTKVRGLVQSDPSLVATTEPITMELLAGATSEQALARIDSLVASMTMLSVEPSRDYAAAAALHRAARATGATVRSLTDCLIASVALRHRATLWHKDADFEVIAGVTTLETLDLR